MNADRDSVHASDDHRDRPDLPWYLDLRLTRWLCSSKDRSTLDLARLDLQDDLAELYRSLPRSRAHWVLFKRSVGEWLFFSPRALKWRAGSPVRVASRVWEKSRTGGLRVLKPVAGVALAGVMLVSAKWLWLDQQAIADGTQAIQSLQEETDRLKRRAAQANKLAEDLARSPRAVDLIQRLKEIRRYYLQVDAAHPGKFHLQGLAGLIEEEIAHAWLAQGDSEKASLHHTRALDHYKKGAAAGDPYASLGHGLAQIDNGNILAAVELLRSAYEGAGETLIQSEQHNASIAAALQYALSELWAVEPSPQIVSEVLAIEADVLARLKAGQQVQMGDHILYNAACIRLQLVGTGVLQPSTGEEVMALLHRAIDLSGTSLNEIAHAVLEDPDLEPLRGLTGFDALESKAQETLTKSQPQEAVRPR